jgi:hypothetical protein
MKQSVFLEDVTYVIHLANLIDKMYDKSDKITYQYLKGLRRVVDRFNEKYPDIMAAVNKTNLNINIKFFVRKNNSKELLKELGSQNILKNSIFGGTSVNTSHHSISENTYGNDISGTLALKNCQFRNVVELLYRNETLTNPDSSEFKLLSHHAQSNNNLNINVKEINKDSFSFSLDEIGGVVYKSRKFATPYRSY